MTYIEYRPAKDWHDCLECEALQKIIWWTPDAAEVVPASLLITAQKNGGLLLCAHDGAQMVGFVFSFVGVEGLGDARRIKHCSHMLAVLPEYRGHGLGFELKRRQREFLIAQGFDLATWTYDPLQAVNARLNVSRLGGIARRYVRDAYGEMPDLLNAGVASDRFEAEWWLNSRRVREKVDRSPSRGERPPAHVQPIFRIEFDDQDLPRVTGEAEFEAETCSIEIPPDLNSLKARNLDLARTWRGQSRVAFESAFARNYTVVETSKWSDDRGHSHVAYVLQKDIQIE